MPLDPIRPLAADPLGLWAMLLENAMTQPSRPLSERLRDHCRHLYQDDVVARIVPQIIAMVDDGAAHHKGAGIPVLDEQSVLQITY